MQKALYKDDSAGGDNCDNQNMFDICVDYNDICIMSDLLTWHAAIIT